MKPPVLSKYFFLTARKFVLVENRLQGLGRKLNRNLMKLYALYSISANRAPCGISGPVNATSPRSSKFWSIFASKSLGKVTSAHVNNRISPQAILAPMFREGY